MNKLIIYLIRKKLGLKKDQFFYFKNQTNKSDRYFFTDNKLKKKTTLCYGFTITKPANIRLNFLLSDEAKELLINE